MPFSPDLRNKLMQAVFHQGTYSGPPKFWVALFNGDPTNTGTEISGGGYVRLEAQLTVTGSSATNSNKILWEPATTDWGNVNYAALYDNDAGGNLLATSALTQPFTITIDTSARIAPGALTIDLPAS